MLLQAVPAVLAFHTCPLELNTLMLIGMSETFESRFETTHLLPPPPLVPSPAPFPPPFPCPSVLLHAVTAVLALHHVDLQLVLLVTPKVAVTHEEKREVVCAGRSGCVELQLDLLACVGWREGKVWEVWDE